MATAGWTFPLAAVRRARRIAFTFFLWTLGGGLFRCASLGDALTFTKHMFAIPEGTFTSVLIPGFDVPDLLLMAFFTGIYLFVDILEERGDKIEDRLAATPPLARWSVYIGITLILLLFGSYGAVPFIYFQF